jgi:hypothetical protein
MGRKHGAAANRAKDKQAGRRKRKRRAQAAVRHKDNEERGRS